MNGWISRMERALALLATRLDEPPTLDELAAAAAVSAFHFHRAWRAMTGETVGQTIARLRVALGQRRLAEKGMSVTAAALAGGFASSQSFARAFRRVAGVSPTEFLNHSAAPVAAIDLDDVAIRVELRGEGELVVLSRHGGPYRALNALFEQLWERATVAGFDLHGIYGMPLDDPASVTESQLRYDACVEIMPGGNLVPPPPLTRMTRRQGRYAVLRHIGSYDDLEDASQRLLCWVLASGHEPDSAPMVHHFLDDPENVPVDELRTDVLIGQ